MPTNRHMAAIPEIKIPINTRNILSQLRNSFNDIANPIDENNIATTGIVMGDDLRIQFDACTNSSFYEQIKHRCNQTSQISLRGQL